MQWHAMAVVLSELSEQPRTIGTERAWRIIDEIGEWDIPEDRAGRILYQSVKKLLTKACAHQASQGIPTQDRIRTVQDKHPQRGHFLPTQASFANSIAGDYFPSQTTFASAPEHDAQQFYVPQHIPQDEMAHQAHIQTWFSDSNIQPLLPDQDLAFNAEYWNGWDPVKGYSIHGGTT
jgi:hypothetical protein